MFGAAIAYDAKSPRVLLWGGDAFPMTLFRKSLTSACEYDETRDVERSLFSRVPFE